MKQCSNCKWVRAYRESDKHLIKGIYSECTHIHNKDSITLATDICSEWKYFDIPKTVFGPAPDIKVKRYSDTYNGLTGVIR